MSDGTTSATANIEVIVSANRNTSSGSMGAVLLALVTMILMRKRKFV